MGIPGNEMADKKGKTALKDDHLAYRKIPTTRSD
jgi:hypothetical protein